MAACPQCKAIPPRGARFCQECGLNLAAKPPAEIRKRVTVLYVDVVGSTGLAEHSDPERVGQLIGRFLSLVQGVLERHNGTVTRIVGDAVVSYFGVPMVSEDDALRALRAAVDVREAVAKLNRELGDGVDLRVRIGVHTGEVLVANGGTGPEVRAGDVVQIAKRLEASAEPGEIRLGEPTLRLTRKLAWVADAQLVEVDDGQPLRTFTLLSVDRRSAGRASRDTPMVGRLGERSLLDWALERTVKERACMMVTVRGVAGVGKSRLVREFSERIKVHALVLSGRCPEYGDGITFWPLLVPLRHVAGISSADAPDAAQAKLLGLFTGAANARRSALRLAQVLGVKEQGFEDVGETFDAVRTLLEVLAARQPVVWVVDDLQWAQPMLFDLLEHIARTVTEVPVLLVCLARPELFEQRERWGNGKPHAMSLRLRPLDDAETTELIQHAADNMPLPDGLVGRIAAAAEGNPLFIEELLSMLVEEGMLVASAGRWRATAALERLEVPPSVRAVLDARLDGLDPVERSVLAAAAVVGNHFPVAAVIDLLDPLGPDGVAARLRELTRKELIQPHSADTVSGEAFRFRHSLIRDAAYDGLAKDALAEAHERHARWLQHTLGERAQELNEIIGYHLREAHTLLVELGHHDEPTAQLGRQAGRLLARAGRRAAMRGDTPATCSLLAGAVSLLGEHDPERFKALLDLADALAVSGQLKQAAGMLAKAESAAVDEGGAMHALLGRLNLLQYTNVDLALNEGGIEAATRARDAFERLGDLGGEIMARCVLANIHARRGQWELARDEIDGCVRDTAGIDEARVEARARAIGCKVMHHGPVAVEEALAYCQDALDWARAHGERRLQAEALKYLARMHAMQERFGEARKLLRASDAINRSMGEHLALALDSISSGFVELLAGDTAAAEHAVRSGYRALREMAPSEGAAIVAVLARTLYERGRIEEARAYAARSEQLAAALDIDAQCKWRRIKARLACRDGDPEAAERLAREEVELADRTDWLDLRAEARLDLALILRQRGRVNLADEEADIALELYAAKQNRVGEKRARAIRDGLVHL